MASKYCRPTLEKFRSVVNNKINMTQSALEELSFAITSLSPNEACSSIKMYEDGGEVSEQDSLCRLADRQRQLLIKLERAIERINDGSYGVCLKTGELISEERLMLVPHTEYSVEAKIPKPTFEKLKIDRRRH